jgi:hypothetical protein
MDAIYLSLEPLDLSSEVGVGELLVREYVCVAIYSSIPCPYDVKHRCASECVHRHHSQAAEYLVNPWSIH